MRNASVLIALLLAVPPGCPSSTTADAGHDATSPDVPHPADAAPADGGALDAATTAGCPASHVTLNFRVDDTANRTYGPNQLIWTGSFAYDSATRTLQYATSWLPEEGPFPALHDDGPITAGGHEPVGSLAGDGIWGVAACYLADTDKTFAYGLLNEELRWIWLGANGQLEIGAGTTGTVDVPGQIIAAHGYNDLRVTLDMPAAHSDYSVIDDTYKTYIKGTMNSWTPVQLLDNGQLGDATADDGIFTYQHSLLLGPHDGLLASGQEAQFVFVFAKGDVDPDDGLEYKVAGDAVVDGVGAEGRCDAVWKPLTVELAMDSKGVSMNTAALMCASTTGPECSDTDPCPGGAACVSGQCAATGCSDAAPCPEGQLCVAGSCVTPECSDTAPCPPGEECIAGACVPASECSDQIACPAGSECIGGLCVGTVECSPSIPCPPGEDCVAGSCVPVSGAQPELVLLIPDVGLSGGGTAVTLHGESFEEGATVTFGPSAAVVTSYSATLIEVTTPPSPVGDVDVTVTNPGGKSATYPNGFSYVEGSAAPSISSVSPDAGPSGGGTPVVISGSNLAAGATVLFGSQTATEVLVSPQGTTLTCATPPNPVGSVPITVENPDGQKVTLAAGFSYTPALPTWGRLNGPLALAATAGAPSALLEGQVYEGGLTDAAGQGFGVTAEVGYGPTGTDPSVDTSEWTFTAAAYSGDSGNDDLYSGSVTIAAPGTSLATLRFSLNGGAAWLYVDASGTDDGFDATALTSVTVSTADTLHIASVVPSTVSPIGGWPVALSGAGLGDGCGVTVDGVTAPSTFTAGQLFFEAPPHPEGDATLEVTCGATSTGATLAYAGAWDGVLDEWPDSAKLTDNPNADAGTDWGPDNVLHALYAASDGVNLYIGVAGKALGDSFSPNAVTLYVDTDSGGGTGVNDTATVTDTIGSVDDALGGALTISASGFGAEHGLATLNMSSFTPGSDDAASAAAGWRGFEPSLGDLFWHLDGGVAASAASEGIEAWIPLATLLGAPTGGVHTLALVARIGNSEGTFLANQALPLAVSGTSNEVSTAASTFDVTY